MITATYIPNTPYAKELLEDLRITYTYTLDPRYIAVLLTESETAILKDILKAESLL